MQTRVISVGQAGLDPAMLEEVLAAVESTLRSGELVAFPTDTVYGLAAGMEVDPIEALYAAKGRENTKAIAVLVGDVGQLPRVAQGLGEKAQRLARRFWPGPLTLVVPAHPGLPPNLSPTPTVGVRMPDHPLALALLRRLGPLPVTSANLSGQPSPVTAQEVLAQLEGRIPLIVDGGRTPGGTASTVVDCTVDPPTLLREGPIGWEALLEAARS